MSAPGPAGPVPLAGVTGGVGGIEARTDDLELLAGHLRRAAAGLLATTLSADLAAVPVLDPVTAALDPAGAGSALAVIASATHGPHGIATLAATTGTLAAAVTAAAGAYTAVDTLAGSPATALAHDLLALPGALAAGAAAVVDGRGLDGGFTAVIAVDPHLVDDAVLTVGLGAPARTAGALARLLPDGHPVVTGHGTDPAVDAAGPPRDVHDLLAALSARNDDEAGAVDVRVLTTVDPDGTVHRRAVVDIPGTKDWSARPDNPVVVDVGTNLRALGGGPTTYADGVVQALAAAGVTPGDDVLFVGHSLGGMVAATAAGRAQALGYRVGGVVTAGSPLGAEPLPRGVPVLALENRGDLVPRLDGAANAAGPDVVTVTVDHPAPDIGDAHGLPTAYLPGAADVDASTDPSVRTAVADLAPFLTADTVQTHVFVVHRAPG